MMFEEKTLVCQDCGQEFIFTVGEQEFYHEKGFENEPKRCRECRTNRRNNRGANRSPREMFSAVCAECGADTQVPFRPVEGRPVYCIECFQKKQKEVAL
ncbi:MAG: zinc-binding protein [Syntrophomonadaceae bacterium]|nr:zinc-binding protein [Syntrophomonadaceae bacterium]